jgi:4-hydroxy-tetrahydrodipicolinate reductase
MKLALIGYGKMGKAIEEIAMERGHTIVLKIASTNKEELTASNLKKADVAIEFSHPGKAVEHIITCLTAGIPVVCGTTGWLNQFSEIENVCKARNGTFLFASNFSVGVNIFFEINKRLAALLNDQKQYDVHIEEIHHTEKKDAPSGTAISLADGIIDTLERKLKWVNETTDVPEELSIISKRVDSVPGTHRIKYSSSVDDIEIIHTAHNRKGFAEGAIVAAEFLVGKKGIFTMKDVLGV